VTNPYGVTRLTKKPGTALVLGGGLGGATTASLLAKMGVDVTVVYKGKTLVSIVDEDILTPVIEWLEGHRVRLYSEASWTIAPDRSSVTIDAGGQKHELRPDIIVLATAQQANVATLRLQNTQVKLNEKGFVVVDEDYRTSDPSVYAIGDVLGGPRNASVAYRDGLSLASILSGGPGLPVYQAMPFTMYMEPQISSAGLTENEAKKRGLDVLVSRAPYAVNGAAILAGYTRGMCKVVADKATHRILGVQIVGANAADIIGEGVLAIEMGARLEDVALTLHPHPELCEVFSEACARGAGLSSNTASPSHP
jgi:dihydrolipoamide dehydrogenase